MASTTASTENKTAEVNKNRLYVKWNFDESVLKSVFETYGEVTDARVVHGMRQRSEYGFITFKSEDAAAKAMAALQGQTIKTTPLAIEFSKPEKVREPRAERKPRNTERKAGEKESTTKREPRERKERAKKDYSSVVAIALNPDPTTTALPTGANLETLKCEADKRQFKSGRQEAQKGEFVNSLAFKPKHNAGGLNASISYKYKGTTIDLKIVSITVKTNKNNDTRIAATVVHPVSGRSADVYLRHFVDEEGNTQIRHKFLELRETDLNPDAFKDVDESKIDPNAKVDAFFVALDKITLDRATGLWSELVISLYRTEVLRRAPRVAGTTDSGAETSSRPPRRSNGGRRRGGRRNASTNGAGAGAAQN